MTTKAQSIHLEEVKNTLREFIKPGDTVYTSLRHVSRSGMYRVINLYVMQDNQPRNIDYLASQLLGGYDVRHEGCKAGGCGMDMGFHLVYTLSHILFRNGFTCPGNTCVSNDHNNPPYPKRDGTMQHTGNGGYALNHRWM